MQKKTTGDKPTTSNKQTEHTTKISKELCICSSNNDTSFHTLVWFFGKYKTTKTILHQSFQTTENKLIYVTHTHNAHTQRIKCGQSAWVTHVLALLLLHSFRLYIHIHIYIYIYIYIYIHTHTHTYTYTQCPENKQVFLSVLINNAVNY